MASVYRTSSTESPLPTNATLASPMNSHVPQCPDIAQCKRQRHRVRNLSKAAIENRIAIVRKVNTAISSRAPFDGRSKTSDLLLDHRPRK